MKKHALVSKLRCALLLAGACLFAATPGEAALTVETSDFLTGYTNYNGFEGMGATTNYPGTIPYTEQGITVQYVGSAIIWTYSQAAEGNYSWYANGGGTGYTQVTFVNPINAVEFQAGSGFFPGQNPVLYYDVLLAGVSIGTGTITGISDHPGFDFYGFSGALFDEIRLQVRTDGGATFNATAYEAGAYDAFNFGVPVP